MKKLLFITLISLIGIIGQAQQFNNYVKANKPEKIIKNEALKTILLYSGSIILNGIGDGLNNSNHKTWGHTCNAASIGVLLASPFIIHYDKSKWYGYILDYTFLRYSLFDASYNLANGQRFDYIGTTAGTDRIFHKAPAGFRSFSKGISLTVGIFLPINNYK
jgi:hypothetical protein